MNIIESVNSNENLLKNVPKELLSKFSIPLFEDEFLVNNEKEFIVLYGQKYESANEYITSIGGSLYDLGYGYGIVTIKLKDVISLASNNDIQYIEFPKELYIADYESNRDVCVQRTQKVFGLDGRGVVIGFIDSGIDYTHPAFIDEEGKSRVEYIFDLSVKPNVVYDNQQINEALKARDPYSVVPCEDTLGHGTNVCGIACAGGKIDTKYYGVADKSSIMMVKSGRGNFSLSTNIMKGLKFLVDKSKELNKPLVVNISLSTNDGAHNGSSLLEKYISTIADSERISIVVAAGNEGDASHHIGGFISDENRINFNVAEDETLVIINFYKSILPKVSIELISPSGVSTGKVLVEEGYKEGMTSQNRYTIFNTGPKPFDLSGDIGISLISEDGDILSGQWTIILRKEDKYEGIYDMWLPISEGISRNTKFLEPTVNNTLGIPATVENVISVGSYDYRKRNISSFSGRGAVVDLMINAKPDVVAPGEDIYSTTPGGAYDRRTGTSMAAPHVSGISALLMEWGIVNGNDPYLFGLRLKYYLILGTEDKRVDVIYPNNSWGYGEVCAYNSMEKLLGVLYRIKLNNSKLQDDFRQKKCDEEEELEKKYGNSEEVVGNLVRFFNVEKFLEVKNLPNTTAVALSPSYGIVYIPIKERKRLKSEGYVEDIVYSVNQYMYTLNDIQPIEDTGVISYHNNPYLSLDGRGVILGIIDTGIDYLNTEFQKEDDTTRIIKIWDQTIDSGEEILGLKLGSEYSEEQINEAIRLQKSGGDPYTIVPSKDTIGHGTMVAGLAAGRGKNPDFLGTAPASDIIMVKLKEASDMTVDIANVKRPVGGGIYQEPEIILAVRYLSALASDFKKPVIIIFALGTNMGAHDGSGNLESSIEIFSANVNRMWVLGTGNEGDTDTHTEGVIEKDGDEKIIEIKVGRNQESLNIQMWILKPDVVSISIISPSGEKIDKIPVRFEKKEDIKFVYEGTCMEVHYAISDRANGDQLIFIRATYLKPGIWQFKLFGEHIVSGKYWAWIPQKKLLDEETKFLNPSQYTTLELPGDTGDGLTVGYYNQNNNSIVSSSGRGYTIDGRVKPDIVAAGINAKVIRPGNQTGIVSGSSVATAIAAGICALILQWAVTEGNYPEIYAKQVVSLILRGAKMKEGYEYPNPEWGYGIISIDGVFRILKGEFKSENRSIIIGKTNEYEEYYIGELFIRKEL